MLSLRTVTPDTLELLKALMSAPELSSLRLVGGTALALQYGHRVSVDLDLFGEVAIDKFELLSLLQALGEVRVINETKNIHQYFVNGIKVDIVNYPYSWIDAPVEDDSIRLASPKDIAALKINAIEGRGTKKDFIDMYLLLQHYSLEEILTFYQQKYPDYSIFRALRSLTYFDDADAQIMPQMFIEDTWKKMKENIQAHVMRYQQNH